MKRVISFVLVVAMTLGLMTCVTGCGSKKNELPSEKVTIKVGIPQRAVVTSYNDNGFTKYLEEAANVDIKFVFFSSEKADYIKQLALMCGAKEKLPDILIGFDLGHYVVNQYGEDGYFMGLNDLVDKYGENYKKAMAGLEKEDPEIAKYVQEKSLNTNDGEMYGMPRVLCTANDDRACDMYINQRWLDKLGLQIPTTIDEFRNVLMAFKTQDPNGNGKNDEIPMIGNDSLINYIINSFVFYEGEYNVENGKIWDAVYTDEFRQALIYANKLVKDGLYSPLSFTVKSTTELKNMIGPANADSLVGVFAGRPASYINVNSPAMQEFTALPALKDATGSGKGGYTVVAERNIAWTAFISKDCQYPEVAMNLLDQFYKDETISRQRHGVKDVDWEYREGTTVCGTKGYVKTINSEAFFEGNSTWCGNMIGIMTHWNYMTVMEDAANDRIAQQQRLAKEAWDLIQAAEEPKERCNYLIYTQEEYELREQYAGLMSSYMADHLPRFCSGQDDPNNDAVWKEFLTNLEKNGRNELKQVAQDAYNRKMKKK